MAIDLILRAKRGASLSGRSAHLLLLLAACLTLNACVTQPGLPDSSALSPGQAATRNEPQGHYARAAELYALAARQQAQPGAAGILRVKGAIAALQANRTTLAAKLLDAVDPAQLDEVEQQHYALARTLLRITPMAPEQALAELPPPAADTAPELAARIWAVRAQLLFAQYKYAEGIHNLVQRGVELADEQAELDNDRVIYQRALGAVELGRDADTQDMQLDNITRGWLKLAAIKLHGPRRGAELQQALARWEQEFPGHPAVRDVLPHEFTYQPTTEAKARTHVQPLRSGQAAGPGPIALVLPLSGDIAQPARAIRQGFEMAHDRTRSARAVTVIDASNLGAAEVLQQVRASEAAIMVGPLRKALVAAVAQQQPRIPTLALNQITHVQLPSMFYTYALAPEDEARTAAAHAAGRGWRRAIALTPEGEWGGRVLDAFNKAFAERGGRLVDYARFNTSHYDHRGAIQQVLRSSNNGKSVDFIFIAARPTHARLLRSQLRYYHAGQLPVVATADVYSGMPEPNKDDDLEGVGFAALPWLVTADAESRRLHEQRTAAAGEAAQRFPHLFAMGIDAWQLAQQLGTAGLQPGMTMQGMTGLLKVGPRGRVQRHLAWARFVNGHAQLETSAVAGAGSLRPVAANGGHSMPTTTSDVQQPDYGPVYDNTGGQRPDKREATRAQKTDAQPNYGPVYGDEPSL